MPYYVLGPGGTKFGPAELDTLNQWVREGRLGPDTLLEDLGGTKLPARAVRGLPFSLPNSTQAPLAGGPSLGTSIGGQMLPGTPLQSMQSNYVRTLSGGGNQTNLFRPGIHDKWQTQGYISLGLGIALGILFAVIPHFSFFRLLFLALGLCIFAVRCGYIGVQQGDRPRGTTLITLSVTGFLLVVGALVYRFMQ